ncbi:putative holin, partial [Pseudomonas sp. 2023EL-01195]
MAEPSLGVLGGVAAGVTVGAAWAGLDLNAVMGALAGSLLFVLFAPDLSIYKRIGY